MAIPWCLAGLQEEVGDAIKRGHREEFNKGNQQGRCVPRLTMEGGPGHQGQGTELYLQKRVTNMSL